MPVSYNTPLDGTPSTVYIATTEKIPYSFDFTANLLGGESLANAGAQMNDETLRGASVTLTDAPSINGNIVVQEVRGAELTAGHVYRLVVSADVVGLIANKRLSISVVVNCPY
jgi:hypothetical protein